MAKLKEYRPKNLPEYLKHVEALQARVGHSLWFRGSDSTTHRLVPSLYRHPGKTKSQDFEGLEKQLMVRFRQRSIPYHSRNLSDDWEALFFMQHYGVPTRLLDWTENPLIGLHFALVPNSQKNGEREQTRAAVVWVLDPDAWNHAVLQHLSYTGGALSAGEEALKGYLPTSTGDNRSAHPVAMYGAHNSARIVAQQGVFTIFGRNSTPMERLVRGGVTPSDTLFRIVIDRSRVKSMRKSLLNQGITESVVFPDLEGLAREIKRHFGF